MASYKPKDSAVERFESRRLLKSVVESSDYSEQIQQIVARMEELDVEGLYFQISSIDGRVLGKLVMRDYVEDVAHAGVRLFHGAVSAVGVQGETIGFANEAEEGLVIPDPETFQVLPWEPRLARVWCNWYHEGTGELLDQDLRGNLMRQEALLEQETGLRVMTGIEPEMMWLKQPENKGDMPTHTTDSFAMYHVAQFHELEKVFLDVVAYGRAMGLKLSHGDHEDASQIEFNQEPSTPLRFADDFVTYRQICRVVARQHGLIASFMPKPFAGVSGNGHHHHVSLVDADGRNKTHGDLMGRSQLSQIALWFAGGLLEHADALTLVGCPSVNSYKRFWDVGFWAPFMKKFGWQNRTVTLRVPAAGRFEIRQFDSSCNPYLTLAGVTAAALDGISRQIDPGQPHEADGSLSTEVAREDRIPLSLQEAIDSFVADPLMKEAFGPVLHDTFLGIRRDELIRYSGQVTPWEIETYLTRTP
ncbi:glutamine synthetase family protein [Nocardioides sambongensis]|uniref:glutamine synthetase family protein n=1 Tax=Nocardioides sambongensis TaxID=2589074 RepID=UPI001127D2F8|nr:glutamine synthetase family protein [Nocardioides sambongensis]